MDLKLDLLSFLEALPSRQGQQGNQTFDPIRRKWVAATPEEMVRQALIQYIITISAYQKSKVQVEKSLTLNGLTKRFDIVVYDKKVLPFMLIECKSFKVKIDQKVADQVARYNMVMGAPYILVSNGLVSYCASIDDNKDITFLNTLPTYPSGQK